MRSLFWKGMLAFLAVILVAVGTVALLIGRTTETEFRRYALVHGGTWNRQALELATYYADHGSWDGAQEVLQALPEMGGPRGRGMGGGTSPSSALHCATSREKGSIAPSSRARLIVKRGSSRAPPPRMRREPLPD